jgi:hypothetical protein
LHDVAEEKTNQDDEETRTGRFDDFEILESLDLHVANRWFSLQCLQALAPKLTFLRVRGSFRCLENVTRLLEATKFPKLRHLSIGTIKPDWDDDYEAQQVVTGRLASALSSKERFFTLETLVLKLNTNSDPIEISDNFFQELASKCSSVR